MLERGIDRALDEAGGRPAPPPDLMPETLPRLAWVCDAAPDRYDDDDEDFFGGPGVTSGRVACPRWT